MPKGIAERREEVAYLFVRNKIAIDVIGPEGVKYAPFLASLFFFIFFMNLLEIVPGINFPVDSRMAIPAILALLTYDHLQLVGIRQAGLVGYFKETLFPPGVPRLDLHPADVRSSCSRSSSSAADPDDPTLRQHDGRPRAADDLLPFTHDLLAGKQLRSASGRSGS